MGGSGPSTEGQRSRGSPEGKTPHFSDLCVEPWGIGEGGRRSNGQSESQASQEAHQVGLQEQEVRAHGAAQQRGRAASLYGEWCCARPLLLGLAYPFPTWVRESCCFLAQPLPTMSVSSVRDCRLSPCRRQDVIDALRRADDHRGITHGIPTGLSFPQAHHQVLKLSQ